MTPPGLATSQTPTEKPINVIPKYLRTSIYFLPSSIPHMPYTFILFPTPVMTNVQAPTHYHYKWLKSIPILSWKILHIHYFYHACTHPTLSNWIESTNCSLFVKLRKYLAYYFLIHPFMNTYMITIPHLLHQKNYDIHINTVQTPPFSNTKSCTFVVPYRPLYTSYSSLPYVVW